MKEAPHNIRKTILVNDEVQKHVDSIRQKMCLGDDSNAIRYAIAFCSSKLTPEYTVKSVNPRPVYDTVEDRLKAKEDKVRQEALAKQAIVIERGRQMCSRLDGNPIDNGNGTFACNYVLYEKLGTRVFKGSRTVPFEMLGEEHIEAQFKGGTKEEILDIVNSETINDK